MAPAHAISAYDRRSADVAADISVTNGQRLAILLLEYVEDVYAKSHTAISDMHRYPHTVSSDMKCADVWCVRRLVACSSGQAQHCRHVPA